MIKAGTKCRVLVDSMNNFSCGDIVVALENSRMPFCCLLEDYDPLTKVYMIIISIHLIFYMTMNWRY